MAYTKPQVTIDLEEYNELLKIKKNSKANQGDLKTTIEAYWRTLHAITQPWTSHGGELARKILLDHPYDITK